MNKKIIKGYTIIELITIIIVMGIIIIITFPIVKNVINRSKQKAYNTSIQNIKASASIYSTEFVNSLKWFTASNENGKESNEEWTCVQIQKLIEKGYLKYVADENDIIATNPENKMETKTNDFVELRREKGTKSLLKDKISLDSTLCNGGYDTTAPTITISLTYDDGSGIYDGLNWTEKNVIQTINAIDANGISSLQMKYEDESDLAFHDIEGAVYSDNFNKLTVKLIQRTDINRRIVVRAMDTFNNGNDKNKSYGLYISKTGPSCEFNLSGTEGNNNWWTTNVQVNLKINSYIENSDYGLTTSSTPVYLNTTMSMVQTEDTIGTIYYGYVKDILGRTNQCQTTIKKETILPTILLNQIPTSFVKGSSYTIPSSVSYGVSGGTIKCNPSSTSTMSTGNNQTITCTATSTAGLTSTTSKVVSVTAPCYPRTSCYSCGGTESNGCGGTIVCEACPTCYPKTSCNTCGGTEYDGCGGIITCQSCGETDTGGGTGGGTGSGTEEECTVYEDQACVAACVNSCIGAGSCVGTTIDGCEAGCTYCH